jgi:diguanylate cyclase (GGDEF)-like protein
MFVPKPATHPRVLGSISMGWILCLLLLWHPTSASDSPPFDSVYQANPQNIALGLDANQLHKVGPWMEWAPEISPTLSFDQMRQLGQFQRFLRTDFNFGIQHPVVWLRFRLVPNTASLRENWYLSLGNPYLHRMVLFEEFAPGQWRKTDLGPRGQLHQVDPLIRQSILSLGQIPAQGRNYYLRLESHTTMQAEIQIATLNNIQQNREVKRWMQGAFTGWMLLLALASLIMGVFAITSPMYIFYGFTVLGSAALLMGLQGLPFALGTQASQQTLQFIGANILVMVMLLQMRFATYFLNLHTQTPFLKWIFHFMSAILMGFAVHFWLYRDLQFTYPILLISSFAIPFCVFISAINLFGRKIPALIPFAFAWGVLAFGVGNYVLSKLGFLPMQSWTLDALQLTCALESTLFSIAVSLRLQKALQERDLLKQRQAQLIELSERDVLTGLHNRRHLDMHLPRLLEDRNPVENPLTFMMLDVDHFKKINDTYGHPVGDQVLRQIGKLLPNYLRSEDVAYRYGGEEFCIVLENTEAKRALRIAERLRLAFSEMSFESEIQTFHATLSVGLAEYISGESAENLKSRADKALYTAKENGRNRTEISP